VARSAGSAALGEAPAAEWIARRDTMASEGGPSIARMILIPLRLVKDGPQEPPLRGRADGAVLDQDAGAEKLASLRSTFFSDRGVNVWAEPGLGLASVYY
jgi:hypothetical protein